MAWSKNWAGGAPAQYANESLLYNRSYTCLQGSAQLDNLHYIACDTDYTWNGFYKDDVNHTREDLIGFRWVLEDEDSLLNKLEPFKTVAVCPSSALKGTIQLEGLPGEALTMLKTHGNPDAIFEVIDIGYGLCRDNNEEGVEMIDIFTGIGEQAYDDTSVFGEKPVQVYTIDLDN